MSRNRNLKIYQNAVPLADAWLEFAAPDRRAEFEQTRGFWETFVSRPIAETPVGMMAAAQAGINSRQARDKLITDMRDWLLDELYDNQIIALGIRKLPTIGHYPVVIDPDYFDNADVDWDRSTVRWEDKLYIDVHVPDPSAIEALLHARKGSIDAVDWAIRELVKANKKFGTLPRQEACELIRKKLGLPDIKGSGLGDINLSKRIVLHCGKKANSK